MTEGLNQLAKGIGKAIETVPGVYDDSLKPATQEIGKTLTLIPRTINAALVPLRKWIAVRENNLAETEKLLAEKLAHVSADKIVTPEPYVAVPTIQAISYSMDNIELRNLYANLLAKAMNIDTKESVHPAYIDIIKQLSPSDALFLQHLCDNGMCIPTINYYLIKYEKTTHLEFIKGSTRKPILPRYVSYANKIPYDILQVCIDNLERLGIIEVEMGHQLTSENVYELLNSEASEIYNEAVDYAQSLDSNLNSFEPYQEHGYINLTIFGHSFCGICIDNNPS
mgnify:CR=1 FL=1|uniref:DUF4393 domain-containing protein n=1 Tax=Caudovirales sp. ctCiv1 TaxID=2826769 RepID=A0A8S5M8J8_9CAUD|nr:DUF4393 domain-containing protein [uncultured Lachnoclostridium sp.]DAD78566.1 MAG TPA: protein of unknown function (DUF4393) [Caudovirales sp. ctCiv1]